jgi:hypothetical protein
MIISFSKNCFHGANYTDSIGRDCVSQYLELSVWTQERNIRLCVDVNDRRSRASNVRLTLYIVIWDKSCDSFTWQNTAQNPDKWFICHLPKSNYCLQFPTRAAQGYCYVAVDLVISTHSLHEGTEEAIRYYRHEWRNRKSPFSCSLFSRNNHPLILNLSGRRNCNSNQPN